MIQRYPTKWERSIQPARKLSGSQYITRTSPVVTATPLTVAFWTLASNPSSVGYIFHTCDNSDNAIGVIGVSAGGITLGAYSDSGSSKSTKFVPASRWFHGAAVFSSVSSRLIYLDGVPGSTSSTTTTVTFTRARWGAGALYGDSPYTGLLQWPCIWNVALNLPEIRLLSSRVPPWLIRPQSIVSCPDLQTLYDPYLHASWTNTGTTLVTPRPFVRPRNQIYLPRTAGGLLLERRRKMVMG